MPELAVHFSRQRESNRADVHVTAVKDVKKPTGAKPGLAYVRRGKTVHLLRRDPNHLERSFTSGRMNCGDSQDAKRLSAASNTSHGFHGFHEI